MDLPCYNARHVASYDQVARLSLLGLTRVNKSVKSTSLGQLVLRPLDMTRVEWTVIDPTRIPRGLAKIRVIRLAW